MSISSAVDPNAMASVVGIETVFKNTGVAGAFLPQRIAVVGQGSTSAVYATTKKQVSSALEVGQTYGFGSPLHLAVQQLLPLNGDGVGSIPVTVYPLEDHLSGVAAAGSILPAGAQITARSYQVSINNILSSSFLISPGDSVAEVVTAITTAINANINMPVTAVDNTTDVILTAKWKGESGNDIKIAIIGDTSDGVTFGITQLTGGLENPDVDAALNQVGSVWETLVLNCLNKSDTATLDKFETFGIGRWQPLVKKPLIVFTGDTEATVALATTIPEIRKTDRVNAQLVSPASFDLSFVVAARQLARIATVAEDNPPTGYNGKIADGLTPAADSAEWTYVERDEAVKKGSSTITKENGQVVLGDIVTFYHPDGDLFPAYRYVVDIVRLQNIIYNLDLIFEADEWRDVPLIPDDQPTVNPLAKKPKTAIAEIAGLLDYLGAWAFISDPATAKTKTIAEIDGTNPNRLNIVITVQLSGNTRIKAITLNFGYLLGGIN